MRKVRYIPGDLVKLRNSAIWFTDDDTVVTVAAVDYTSNNITICCGLEYYAVDFEDIIPIPITEELLLNNGWCSNDEGSCSISSYVDIELEQNGKMWYVIVNHYFLAVEIQYVHELQHLMFSLGIDHYLKVK